MFKRAARIVRLRQLISFISITNTTAATFLSASARTSAIAKILTSTTTVVKIDTFSFAVYSTIGLTTSVAFAIASTITLVFTGLDASTVATTATICRFVFHSPRNHRITHQSHGTENRQGLSCCFLEEFSSALGFVVFVVFHS